MINFSKQESETVNDYIYRLGLQRNDLDISWEDIVTCIRKEFHQDLTKDAVRCRYRRIIKNPNYNKIINTPQKIEDRVELERIKNERLELNSYYRCLSREATIKDLGIEAAQLIANKNPFSTPVIINRRDASEYVGILLISDWHYGIEINTPFNVYNPNICKERVLKNLLHNVQYYVELFNLSKLYVINLGDMIAGNIHLPLRLGSQIDVITQIMEVSELIATFLNELSKSVDIIYYSTLDNHSRINPNKKESIQLETLARITDWFLVERLKYNSRTEINIENKYSADIVSFRVDYKNYNYKVVGVHGDKDNPTQIIGKLTTFTKEHQDLICAAHYHHFNCEEQNRTMFISNGALMGTDEYAVDLRLDSKPSQTLIIADQFDVCKHICKLNLDEDL